MKYRYVRRLQALVLTGALGTVAFAATPQPTVPVIRFPGADWKRVACTVGPAVPENATVDRVVREFIDGVQRGHVDPKTSRLPIMAIDPAGVRRFFSQIGAVRTLQFRGANTACSSGTVNYRYHVVGRKASADLLFTVTHGRIEGYAQDSL